MIEVGDRLVYWTAAHPSWRPNPEWPREVGCVLYRHPAALVLIDPLLEDDTWSWLDDEVARVGAPVIVLLTAPWHERSVRAVASRYGAGVCGAQAAQARLGGIAWLDEPPAGIRVFVPGGVDEGQVAYFIEPERTLIVAELFLGTEGGLEVRPSPATTNEAAFRASLRELEALPVARVLVGHGPPVLENGAAAIAAALRRF